MELKFVKDPNLIQLKMKYEPCYWNFRISLEVAYAMPAGPYLALDRGIFLQPEDLPVHQEVLSSIPAGPSPRPRLPATRTPTSPAEAHLIPKMGTHRGVVQLKQKPLSLPLLATAMPIIGQGE